jgi:hypothetical protein
MLKVEILKPISAMGILIPKGLSMVITYHLLLKDGVDAIS